MSKKSQKEAQKKAEKYLENYKEMMSKLNILSQVATRQLPMVITIRPTWA